MGFASVWKNKPNHHKLWWFIYAYIIGKQQVTLNKPMKPLGVDPSWIPEARPTVPKEAADVWSSEAPRRSWDHLRCCWTHIQDFFMKNGSKFYHKGSFLYKKGITLFSKGLKVSTWLSMTYWKTWKPGFGGRWSCHENPKKSCNEKPRKDLMNI